MMRTVVKFGRMVGLGAILVAPLVTAQAQEIGFSDFASEKGLTLNGAAKVASVGDRKALRVTPAEETQAGSAFFTEKVALKEGFETTFTFQITGAPEEGADGFAFVIQNSSPQALGSPGSGLGYGVADEGEAAIAKSLAIEFDTFSLKDLGGGDGEDFGDPNGNHISVHSRGPEPNHVDEAYSLGKVTEGLPNFKDGKPHKVKISYAPGSLKIYVDDLEKPVQTLAIKLDAFSGKGFQDASVLDAEGKAWVGFTAGTGGLMENHDILSWAWTTRKPGA
jgi:hypothetical protein